MRARLVRSTFLLLFLFAVTTAQGALPKLIPRSLFFGNAKRQALTISPDGQRIAWLEASEAGVMNVWTSTLGKPDGRMVTAESAHGVQSYRWSADGEQLLYLLDSDGDRNYHLFSVQLTGKGVRDLTPFRGVRAQNVITNRRKPGQVLVALNLRDPRTFDMYRIDLQSGAVNLDTMNPGDVISWTVDADLLVRGATAFDPETLRTTVRTRETVGSPWRDILTSGFEATAIQGQLLDGTLIAGFTPDGAGVVIVAPRNGSDHTEVWVVDARTGAEIRTIAAEPRADVALDATLTHPLVLLSPKTGEPEAVAFESDRMFWKAVDPSIESDFQMIAKDVPTFIDIVSRDADDTKWIFRNVSSDRPSSYYLYDRESKEVLELFNSSPELSDAKLGETKSSIIRSRDGHDLLVYLTLPPGVAPKSLPLAVVPHGQFGRDRDEYDPRVQWLASRGFAVLRVNYRGSAGLGIAFLNLGNHEFGLHMQDDISDAVAWAIGRGVASKTRIAILGLSGNASYFALRGLITNPELYACAVDVNGYTDLRKVSQAFPSYVKAYQKAWGRRMCDCLGDDGVNRSLSPIYATGRVRRPLFVAQTKNHWMTKEEQTNAFVAALRATGKEVTYVYYPDEGTSIDRPENLLDLYGRLESFLSAQLGTRGEARHPVAGTSARRR